MLIDQQIPQICVLHFLHLSGTLWYLLAVNTSDKMHQNVMLFEFMFGPDFVLDNLFRCFSIFSFLAFAMIFKTILTIGFSNTVVAFEGMNGDKVYNILTGEKFIQGSLIRAFFNGSFLIIGWGLVIIFAKKKIAFLGGKRRKKRRKRHQEFSEYLLVENYQKILSKL